MSDLFKSRYRISTSRYPDWDYASPGIYFVTICTKSHQHYFGAVINGEMHLNKIGTTANQHWKTIPHHHNNVQLDEFIIMPNHVHGILILFDNDDSVETLHATSLRDELDPESELFRSISPKRGSLSTIIRSYKSSVTRIVRKNILVDFTWQSRFYDHIIRTEQDLERLREYILLNPLNWSSDDPENRLREDDAHA